MVEMSWEKQNKIIDIANNATYLLGLHIETHFKKIVAENDDGDYIVEVADIIVPNVNTTRNMFIQEYFTKEMDKLNMEFVKLEKTCFSDEIYYHLCYTEKNGGD